MRVIKNNILISEPVEREKTTESGFILPKDRVDFSKPLKSTVVAIGSEVKEVKIDDVIYYLPGTGDIIQKDDINYRIITEDNVLAVE